jgi:hypothetical protein
MGSMMMSKSLFFIFTPCKVKTLVRKTVKSHIKTEHAAHSGKNALVE